MIISPIEVSGDVTPFMTKMSMPKGGVDWDISRFTSMTSPNHMGSHFMA